MENQTLKEIFYSHDDRLIHKWDHYFDIYEKYFSGYRGKELNLLEIGISQGGSLQLWKKYFGDKLNIYAIDINPECKVFEDEKTKIFIGSQSDQTFLSDVLAQLPDIDIIIDDGGHMMDQQKVSFEMLYPKVKQGGVYIVEDTHTSYWYEFHGGLRNKNSFIEYSKNLVDSLYDSHVTDKSKIIENEHTANINSIAFYDSIVVFEKLKRKDPYHIRKGEKSINDYMPTEAKKKTRIMRLKEKFLGKKLDTYVRNDRGTAK